jgi:hypothetical protein
MNRDRQDGQDEMLYVLIKKVFVLILYILFIPVKQKILVFLFPAMLASVYCSSGQKCIPKQRYILPLYIGNRLW